MKARLFLILDRLVSSYWFIPAVMAIASVGLSLFAIGLDRSTGSQGALLPRIYDGNINDTRTILSTIAGSMITVVGIIFSTTFVALSHTSTQLGPRLLDNFLRDTGNQVVLGTLASTFLYCLLVLRSMRSGDPQHFVPRLSVTFSLFLAVASVGMLIYFFHHVAFSLHTEKIVASVGRSLDRAVDRLLPDKGESYPAETELRDERDIPERFDEEAATVPYRSGGYLQTVDYEELFRIATEHDLVLRINFRPGDYVPPERGIIAVWPGRRIDEELGRRLNRTLIVGTQPMRSQDVNYEIDQLVAIAIRALSPSLNDSFLAMFCIDRLSTALSHLAHKTIAASYRYDENGRLRLIIKPFTFDLILDAAFHQIRQNSASDVAVTIRLLEALATIASFMERPQEQEAIRRHAEMIRRGSNRIIQEPEDLRDIEERYAMVIRTIDDRNGTPTA